MRKDLILPIIILIAIVGVWVVADVYEEQQFNRIQVVNIQKGYEIQNQTFETDYNSDGIPDVLSNFTFINDTFIEVFVDDTRETSGYKWASAICNTTPLDIVKYEYNPSTEVWTNTGSLNYGTLWGLPEDWCPNHEGFSLYGAGSGDKQYRIEVSKPSDLTFFAGKGSEETYVIYQNQSKVVFALDGQHNATATLRLNKTGTFEIHPENLFVDFPRNNLWKFGANDTDENETSWNQYQYELIGDVPIRQDTKGYYYDLDYGNYRIRINDICKPKYIEAVNETWDPNCQFALYNVASESIYNLNITFYSNYLIDPEYTFTNDNTETLTNDARFEGSNNTHINMSISDIYANLTLYHSFDADDGVTAYDLSTYDNDGTFTQASLNTSCGLGYDDCVTMDGDGDWIEIGDNMDSQIDDEVTVMFWAYPHYYNNSGAAVGSVWFGGRGLGSATDKFAVSVTYWESQNMLVFDAYDDDTRVNINVDGGSFDSTYPINNWYHIALTVNSSDDVAAFINGAQVGTASGLDGNIDFTNAATIYLGRGSALDSNYGEFNGSMDELMVFNKGLNVTQIAAIYTNQSARFKYSGTSTHKQQFRNDSGYNWLNLDLDSYEENMGTNISTRVGYWDVSAGYRLNWTPSSVDLIAGTLNSGDVSSMATINSVPYNISEAVSTPGYEILLNFTEVEDFQEVKVVYWYSGSAGHTVDGLLYNYDTLTWDSVLTPVDTTSYETILSGYISDYKPYINGGNVLLTLNHTSPGNINHELALDYVGLQRDSGLVSYWHFDGAWTDAMGNYDLTVANGAPDNDGTGLYSTGAEFLGGNNDERLNVGDITGHFNDSASINAWVYTNNSGNNDGLWHFTTSNTYTHYPYSVGPNIYFNTFRDDQTNCGASWLTLNEWHMLTIVQNPTTGWKAYHNGVVKCSTAGEPSAYIGTLSYIGTSKTDRDFGGQMDEIMLWNRSLTADEIKELYVKGRAKFSYTDWVELNQSVSIDPDTTVILPEFNLTSDANQFYTPWVLDGGSLTTTLSAGGFECTTGDPTTTCYLNTTYNPLDGENLNGTGNLVIQDSGVITNNNAMEGFILNFTNITILSGGQLQAGNITIYAQNLTIESGATINANELGHPNKQGIGGGGSTTRCGGGGSHANAGGDCYNIGPPAGAYATSHTSYGSTLAPVTFGSGGGDSTSENPDVAGGYGGGAIRIDVTDTVNISGTITVDGGDGVQDNSYDSSGGGAGGSIYITTFNLTGDGTVSATGGEAQNGNTDGGSGSGGRVAIYYNDSSFDSSNSDADAGNSVGGIDYTFGFDGTFILVDSDDNNVEVVSGIKFQDNTGLQNETINTSFYNTNTPTTYSFNDLLLNNDSLISGDDSTTIISMSTLNSLSTGEIFFNNVDMESYGSHAITFPSVNIIFNGSDWESNDNQEYINLINLNTISFNSSTIQTGNLSIEAVNITVASSTTISTDGYGFAGGAVDTSGDGPGGGTFTFPGPGAAGGAGHGGYGGNGTLGGSTYDTAGIPYGNESYPITFGSGGAGGGDATGGDGGGIIYLNASDAMIIDGTISADGDDGSAGPNPGAGGSGGSILLVGSTTLNGSGNAGAIGGQGQDDADDEDAGGGSGGRIAMYTASGTFSCDTSNVSAGGALGSGPPIPGPGDDGTLVCSGFADVTDPEVTFNEPPNNTITNNASVNFTFNATDDTELENATIYLNGTANESVVFADGLTEVVAGIVVDIAEGVWEVVIRVYDLAGNFVDSLMRLITVDRTGPDITFNLPANTTYRVYNLTINLTATDALNETDTIWYTNSSGDNVTYVDGQSYIYGLGTYTFYAWANDSLNNTNAESVVFTVDTLDINSVIVTPSFVDENDAFNITVNVSSWDGDVGCNITGDLTGAAEFGVEAEDQNLTFEFSAQVPGVYLYNATCWNLNDTEIQAGSLTVYEERDLVPTALTFSNNNPSVLEVVTITATVNSSNQDSSNVLVYFYSGATLIGNDTITTISADSSDTAAITYAFPTSGLKIVKAWVNPLQSLDEDSYANNNISRVISVGGVNASDTINVSVTITANPTEQYQQFHVSGTAVYDIDPYTPVAGADVVLDYPGDGTNPDEQYTTTTNDAGFYNFTFIDADNAVGNYTINISVNDGSATGTNNATHEIIPVASSNPDFTNYHTGMTVFTPENPLENEQVTVNSRVRNLGGVAGSTNVTVTAVDFYLSYNSTELSSGSNSAIFNNTVSYANSGNYQFTYTCDPDNDVVEDNEGNNIKYEVLTVYKNETDLDPTTASVNDTTPVVNEYVVYTLTIKNLGGLEPQSAYDIYLYENGTKKVTNTSATYIKFANSTAVQFTHQLTTAGVRNITFSVNEPQNITEYNYTNNNYSTTITVLSESNPDFIATAMNVDQKYTKGSTQYVFVDYPLNFSGTFGNTGNNDSYGSIEVYVKNGTTQLNTTNLDGLNVSQTKTFSWYTNLSRTNMSAFTLNASINDNQTLTEDVYTNNWFTRTFTPMFPDIEILSNGITYNDSNVDVNESVEINATVTNLDLIAGVYDYNVSFSSNLHGYIGSDLINVSANGVGTASVTFDNTSDRQTHVITVTVSPEYKDYEIDSDGENASANNIATTSLVVGDITAPTINLTNPPNATSSTNTTYDLNYTATDDSGISSCNLTINDVQNSTTTGTTNFTNLTFAAGTYNWYVSCNDSWDNWGDSDTWTFTVTSTTTTTGGGGGGEGPLPEIEYVDYTGDKDITQLDIFQRLFNFFKNPNDGICNDGEYIIVDPDCNLNTQEFIKLDFIKYAWFFRLFFLLLILALISKKFDSWMPVFVIIGLLMVVMNMNLFTQPVQEGVLFSKGILEPRNMWTAFTTTWWMGAAFLFAIVYFIVSSVGRGQTSKR